MIKRSTPWEIKTSEGFLEIVIDHVVKGWTDRGLIRELMAQMGPQFFKSKDDKLLLRLIADARAKTGIEDPDDENATPTVPIIASAYVWTEPEAIPKRDWLYGTLLVRRFLSMTVAGGGIGKSTLIVAEVLAMVSGFPLLGVRPPRRLKVWLWNLEDPAEETSRKIQAAAKHYGLQRSDIEGHLFVNSGRDTPLVIAKTLRDGVVICHPVVDELIEQIKEKEIDVLIVDPFVSSHEVTENDNNAIDMVAKKWSAIAELADCAIELVHHTRKAPPGTEVTAESSRGAKALTDASRITRAINQMSEAEGKKTGVENHRLYFRTFDDKANMAPPAAKSDWFKLISINLENGPSNNPVEGGDKVGVVTQWEYPDVLDGITEDDFDKVAAVIRGGKWRKNAQSPQWVGHAVAQALRLNAEKDRAKVMSLLKLWRDTGLLIDVKGEDDKRMEKVFVEVAGKSVEPVAVEKVEPVEPVDRTPKF